MLMQRTLASMTGTRFYAQSSSPSLARSWIHEVINNSPASAIASQLCRERKIQTKGLRAVIGVWCKHSRMHSWCLPC